MKTPQLMASTSKARVVRVKDGANGVFYTLEKMVGTDALGFARWETCDSLVSSDLSDLFQAIFDFPSVEGVSL